MSTICTSVCRTICTSVCRLVASNASPYELAVDAGVLMGTSLVTRPLQSDGPARQIGLAWRRRSGRRDEFLLFAQQLAERAKPQVDRVRRRAA